MRFGLQVNPYYFGSTGNPWDLVAPIDARILPADGRARVAATVSDDHNAGRP